MEEEHDVKEVHILFGEVKSESRHNEKRTTGVKEGGVLLGDLHRFLHRSSWGHTVRVTFRKRVMSRKVGPLPYPNENQPTHGWDRVS